MTEAEEPAAQSFELEGWKCEELSGYGIGCVGYAQARAASREGVQVCFTNDTQQAEPMPEAVRAWLLEGRKP
jgi:acyl-CoA thioesterase FadM